jgi:hypothetical protein
MLKLSKITRKENSNGLPNYSLMFTGKVEGLSSSVSLLSLLNKGDNRFIQANDATGYINKATQEGIEAMFGKVELPINIGDETLLDLPVDGICFKVTETVTIPEYITSQAAGDSVKTKELVTKLTKKIKNEDGSFSYFVSEKGEAVFRTTEVVAGKSATHTIVPLLKGADGKTVKISEEEFLDNCITINAVALVEASTVI